MFLYFVDSALGSALLILQNWLQGGFALRPFSTSLQLQEASKQASGSEGQRRKPGVPGEVIQQVERDEITDQIPHIVRPMGVIEGTSYTVLIIAGLAFAGLISLKLTHWQLMLNS